jgi:flagellar basal-body rod modification protein FlgD
MISSIATGQTPATNTVAKPVGLADTFDTFLKLLTTQLQNQDPLSPLDTNQFTQQLVQFSQVEQTIKGNQTLQQLLATTQNAQFSNAAAYLGRTVSANVDLQNIPSGQSGNWNYTLGATSAATKLEIFSERGVKVFEATGALQAGPHQFSWNGKDTEGRGVPAGNYRLAVSSVSAAGTKINSSVSITGRVDSLEVDEGVNKLLIGTTPVQLSQINRVIAQ